MQVDPLVCFLGHSQKKSFEEENKWDNEVCYVGQRIVNLVDHIIFSMDSLVQFM